MTAPLVVLLALAIAGDESAATVRVGSKTRRFAWLTIR